MVSMKTFNQKLEKLCRKRRWKQAALMNAVNDHCRDDPVSKSTVSRWLNGEGKPFDQWALALARALEVPLDYLADDAQEDPLPGLKPDERSLVEIYRGFRDNEGMTLEEARDRLMAPVPGRPDDPVPRRRGK
jgi:transcriptional regulator with XRE-family HTH domain